MINVTKSYLPSFEEYAAILKRAWEKSWLTNNGELVQELEIKLREYLDVKNLWFASNGTVVLQMALKALSVTKEVITTSFSYVATTNSILWEGCKPVFVDIDPQTFCIDVTKIEAAITKDTQAILATHVYGFPCDVEAIDAIAKKYNLKIIYDGAHAFGVQYKGKALLSYGDISTCSFHATKLFHTVEGGCIIANDDNVSRSLMLYRSFGHIADDYFTIGINAKNSEFHAAMGLALLPKVEQIITERKNIFDTYNNFLPGNVVKPSLSFQSLEYNYAYFAILFENETSLLKAKKKLEENQVNTRRYFYPSLNLLPQVVGSTQSCPVSEDISKRVLCLPIYPGLQEAEIIMICKIIRESNG